MRSRKCVSRPCLGVKAELVSTIAGIDWLIASHTQAKRMLDPEEVLEVEKELQVLFQGA